MRHKKICGRFCWNKDDSGLTVCTEPHGTEHCHEPEESKSRKATNKEAIECLILWVKYPFHSDVYLVNGKVVNTHK